MKRLHIGKFEITVKPADQRRKPLKASAHGIVGEHWAVETGLNISASMLRAFRATDLQTGSAGPELTETAIDAAGLVAELDAIGPFSTDVHEALQRAFDSFRAEMTRAASGGEK